MPERIYTKEEHEREAKRLEDILKRMEKAIATTRARWEYHKREAERETHSSPEPKQEEWEFEFEVVGREEIRKQVIDLQTTARVLAKDIVLLQDAIDEFYTDLRDYLMKRKDFETVNKTLREVHDIGDIIETHGWMIKETAGKLKELLLEIELS